MNAQKYPSGMVPQFYFLKFWAYRICVEEI